MKSTLVFLLLSLGFIGLGSCQIDPAEYKIRQDSVWIETSNGKIFGLLFTPVDTKKEKLPAVLCLQGGGDVGLANYTYEARFFAKNGIAALVCDKSGSGPSKTRKSWREQSFRDITNEYFELFEWLSNQSGIDRNKVGLHGMSQGGRLSLSMATLKPDKIAFVNAVSGPTISYKENQLYALKNAFQEQNIDSELISKALKSWEMYFNDIAKGEISETTLSMINELIEVAPHLRYRPDNSGELPIRPQPEDIHFSVEGDLQNITCPALLQYGQLDILVDPIASLALIPDKANFEIKNYADTDHSMNFANGDINPLFLEDKLIWIQNILEKK
ncbi:MAG: alpha/beta fold hydrolase [Marinoscillum sp.]